MDNQYYKQNIIQEHPIGNGLEGFRSLFAAACHEKNIPNDPNAVDKLDGDALQDLVLDLVPALLRLRASHKLPSAGSSAGLFVDISQLISAVDSKNLNLSDIKPLFVAILDQKDDAEIWDKVYEAVAERTPPPGLTETSATDTAWRFNTSGFANSFEYRRDINRVLKEELGTLYVGVPGFREAFFRGVAELDALSEAIFQQCKDGNDPLFCKGWKGWPTDAKQDDVLEWLDDIIAKITALAESHKPHQARRRLLAQPTKPIQGSARDRKLDCGFVSDSGAKKDSRCHWSQILVPGELKSNPSADIALKAWLDLGKYAREVLAAQDTRRFVLGFTLCGSLMRIWEFDRLGGIASEQFDVNKDGLQFISTILGFLWMSEKDLGFDPTIITSGDKRYIEIDRNGHTERLILNGLMRRAPCIAGRATTCWKAYHEKDPSTPLVIKDSWQDTLRVEEGELLQKALQKGVINVARYYHHETIHVDGAADDISGNVRSGLDVSKATNFQSTSSRPTPDASTGAERQSRSPSAGVMQLSDEIDIASPPTKRIRLASPTRASIELPNRVHRRIILRDYGKPICKASSREALLAAMEGCIKGHESLYHAGFLHRDISVNNLIINKDDGDPSWYSFLIDLDLAVEIRRDRRSGASGKTGTRAFMAIGALLGEPHSYMHDLESFFWVIFWVCIHYRGSGKSIGPTQFESWNYEDDEKLARSKHGTIGDKDMFLKTAEANFTPFYKPLIPVVDRLRRRVFPGGTTWKKEDPDLYASMKEILVRARK